MRVVTASYVVPWHLGNTLTRIPGDFNVCVVGQHVSSCRASYPGIEWADINLNRKINLFADLAAFVALCRVMVVHKPDLVHSIMPKAGLMTALAGFVCRVPVRIHTFTGQIWATKSGLSRKFYYWQDRLINSLNTICLTDSPSQSAFLQQHGISHDQQPLPVLSKGSLSGVDVERFNRREIEAEADELRRQLGLTKASHVFAFIARKSRDKGAIDTLRAFSAVSGNHPAARLLFVGPDETGGELEALQRSEPALFNNVVNVDKVDNHEVYLAIADVLCLPSYREGFGSIVIDAAAMNIPTIGSNIPGLTDSIVDGETGILIPAGDIDALAGVMNDILAHPERIESMRQAAKTRVEQFFTADLLYDALKTLYLETLESNEREDSARGA